MTIKSQEHKQVTELNTIVVDGVIFRTGGNILFGDPAETPYYLAEGSKLEKIEGIVEHGWQTLLKKLK